MTEHGARRGGGDGTVGWCVVSGIVVPLTSDGAATVRPPGQAKDRRTGGEAERVVEVRAGFAHRVTPEWADFSHRSAGQLAPGACSFGGGGRGMAARPSHRVRDRSTYALVALLRFRNRNQPDIRGALVGRARRIIALPLAVLVATIGSAHSATATTTSPERSTVTVSAERLLKGGWEIYQTNFSSLGTCTNQRNALSAIYTGYWIGGWAESRCVRYALPTCGATTYRYRIEVRYWYSENGPFRVAVPAPVSPSAVVAAC